MLNPRFNLRNFLLVFCTLPSLLCSEAFAAPYVVMGNMVTRLNTGWGAEGLYVETAGTSQNGAACGTGNVFFIEQGGLMNKEMTSLLMMAMQNDFPVDLYVDGCLNSAMRLKAVYINKRR
ncbi:hypothetical protein VC279_23645 [Xanthomonas sp. WHRI 10064A]|uniref:hypothetical protein n=1 Tax=unclassified Xanthomonas TaxID=2643310 RepID=UPI002B235968|nr:MULTISPECIES: hypothetical protein [unclassified Xanthomonas]MEA9590106.1 hypothetical protein [Xanthomonas sp. WHRI 10064B]MEA9617585.1 hypothetical protein [Xanthomonas sp. WHRI 10064A]